MRRALLFTLACGLGLPASAAPPGVAVVELFTSEGCSSCPPAEALLNDLDRTARQERAAVYALAFHVDYWNYLGWEDRFSKKAFADRQRKYGAALEGGRVYTPQMVVNGRTSFLGSDRRRARAAIDRQLRSHAPAEVMVTARKGGKHVDVRVQLKGQRGDDVVQIALVAHDLRSRVTRGENAGRTLVHRGVVRSLRTEDAAKRVTVQLPLPEGDDELEVIAFVQARSTGAVRGAGRAQVSPKKAR